MPSGSRTTRTRPGARWRAPSPRRRSAASSFERLPPRDPGAWPRYLGRKISIRHRVHDDPEHDFSEAIGVVSTLTEDSVTILNKKGESVTITFGDIVIGKAFT